ncbi:hypothetical protein CsatB_024683 [Cannabis sativa]
MGLNSYPILFALFAPFRRPSKAVVLGLGDGGFRRSGSNAPRGSRRSWMVTRRGALSAGSSQRSVWVSKSIPAGGVPPIAKSGRKGAIGIEENEKESEPFPGMEPPISEAITDRSSMFEPNLNMCGKEGFISLMDRAQVEPISEGGPSAFIDPIHVKCLNQGNVKIATIGDKSGDAGPVAIGPCVSKGGLAASLVDKETSPMLLDVNMGNIVSGPSLINNNTTLSCGPTLVDSQMLSNPSSESMGPAMMGRWIVVTFLGK